MNAGMNSATMWDAPEKERVGINRTPTKSRLFHGCGWGRPRPYERMLSAIE